MKSKKIVVLSIFVILAIVLTGSASAIDFGFLSGAGSESQDITVGGHDFSIPGGFNENKTYHMDHEKISTDYVDMYISTAGYEDDSKDNAIFVMINEYDGLKMTDDDLDYMADADDFEKTSINGHDGYLTTQKTPAEDSVLDIDQTLYMFTYTEDGDLVVVGTSQESYLDEVIK